MPSPSTVRNSLVILLFLGIVLSQCQKKQDQPEQTPASSQTQTTPIQQELTLDTAKVAQYIQQQVENLLIGEKVILSGDSVFSRKVLPQLYQNRSFRPAWLDTAYAATLLKAIASADQEGLMKEEYHYTALTSLKKQLDQQETDSASILAQFDILLTDGILKYGNHLLNGKILPKDYISTWNYKERMVGDTIVDAFQKAMHARTIVKELDNLKPDMRIYTFFKEKLVQFHTLAQGDTLPNIPEVTTSIRPKTSQPAIALIKDRLRFWGYLPARTDTAREYYDDSLLVAVKQFQAMHALEADGVIGKTTIREMNTPVKDRIDQIRINLERLRWVASSLSDRYMIVNIAAFELYLFEQRKLLWSTNVMTGAVTTSTPIFKSQISYLVFNPTWTVPTSIVNSSIIPGIKRDASYLAKNHYTLVSYSGKTVSAESINRSTISARNFPYSVVQTPGSHNALGKVKFMFPNQYAIYLHDTPSKHLFTKTDRAFSHGCIRVQDPLKLAQILLADTLNWSAGKIQQVVGEGTTKTVFLKNKLDIMIMYWTTGMDASGYIKFYKDIYKRDPELLKALNQFT
ncbi:L,D-transpeptidase family protein [Rhodocytophaga rosea]|uniref:L,D-transpeptidase family protein n=1 Tax=Rhodocytophaga rosea TaxID=2704465 RepID=A0A6C0GP74_9BACT|nr:L,D-transpeptidase family protein [Rhodocytophaga rosea]QHT69727.1 L,D-transpeptidase family protein [Rhodocytophaga rosea]